MSISLNIIQWKFFKKSLILSITQIKPLCNFPNFSMHYISKKTDLKFS